MAGGTSRGMFDGNVQGSERTSRGNVLQNVRDPGERGGNV